MFKKIMLVWSLLLLAGCETFVANSKTKTTIVTWNIVDDVHKTCSEKGIKMPTGMKVLGCATFNETMLYCEIYTNKETTLNILGHEMRHCFEGYWHE